MNRERRQYYRFRFPAQARPVLWVNGKPYVITELSEGGMRLLRADKLKANIDGELIYSDGRSTHITGRVLRTGPETVICNLNGVSFSDLMREQRRLVRLFPLMG